MRLVIMVVFRLHAFYSLRGTVGGHDPKGGHMTARGTEDMSVKKKKINLKRCKKKKKIEISHNY